jgi:hypothetical protein
MKDETSWSAIRIIGTALLLVKLVRSLARMWADRQVRRMLHDIASRVTTLLDRVPTRQRHVFPGSPRSARLTHWLEAAILCIYVGYFLVAAAAIATLAVSKLPHIMELNPLAEPAAAAFICLFWFIADFFYKEALRFRSEVTGLPAFLA